MQNWEANSFWLSFKLLISRLSNYLICSTNSYDCSTRSFNSSVIWSKGKDWHNLWTLLPQFSHLSFPQWRDTLHWGFAQTRVILLPEGQNRSGSTTRRLSRRALSFASLNSSSSIFLWKYLNMILLWRYFQFDQLKLIRNVQNLKVT